MNGLIIQGPIVSKGRTGKSANISFNEVKEDDVVNFNCLENIKKIYDEFRNDFEHIILVTWKGQNIEYISELEQFLPKQNILLLDDNTIQIPERGNVIPGNNKYRQFLSIYEGAKYLASLGCEYIIKVRTDQYLDCKLILSDTVNKLSNTYRNNILVPWINTSNCYTLTEVPDFYFAARTEVMIKFSGDIITLPEVFSHVHTDIFYKWTLGSLNKYFFLRKFIYLVGRFGNNFLTKKILLNKQKGFFIPLESNIIDSIEWRGEKYNFNFYDRISLNEIDYKKAEYLTFFNFLKIIYIKAKSKLYVK